MSRVAQNPPKLGGFCDSTRGEGGKERFDATRGDIPPRRVEMEWIRHEEKDIPLIVSKWKGFNATRGISPLIASK